MIIQEIKKFIFIHVLVVVSTVFDMEVRKREYE